MAALMSFTVGSLCEGGRNIQINLDHVKLVDQTNDSGSLLLVLADKQADVGEQHHGTSRAREHESEIRMNGTDRSDTRAKNGSQQTTGSENLLVVWKPHDITKVMP
jgi:hypothetical protein